MSEESRMDPLRIAEMMAWIGEEQRVLWHELSDALTRAINGAWSIEASNIARRIIEAARLVGPTERGSLPYGLEAGGVYDAIYAVGGIEVRQPSEDEWQRWDGLMGKYNTTRVICRPQYAATVAAITEERERGWLAGRCVT